MYIQNVSLGNQLWLLLSYVENNPLTPSSATIQVFSPSLVSPYYNQVGSDINVLTVGGELATGKYGLVIDTSSYTAGQYAIYSTWTSSVSGYTYIENGVFNVAADASATISRIDAATAQISKIPFPDNRAIKAIAQTLGIKDQWNERYLAMVSDTNEFSKNLGKSISTISHKMDLMSKSIKEGQQENKISSDTIKYTMLTDMLNNIKSELNSAVESISMKSEDLNSKVTSKDDLFDSFDLYSKQMVALFQKVNVVMDQISELSTKIDDMNLTLPAMVAEEQAGMATAAAKQMITEQFRTGQTRL